MQSGTHSCDFLQRLGVLKVDPMPSDTSPVCVVSSYQNITVDGQDAIFIPISVPAPTGRPYCPISTSSSVAQYDNVTRAPPVSVHAVQSLVVSMDSVFKQESSSVAVLSKTVDRLLNIPRLGVLDCMPSCSRKADASTYDGSSRCIEVTDRASSGCSTYYRPILPKPYPSRSNNVSIGQCWQPADSMTDKSSGRKVLLRAGPSDPALSYRPLSPEPSTSDATKCRISNFDDTSESVITVPLVSDGSFVSNSLMEKSSGDVPRGDKETSTMYLLLSSALQGSANDALSLPFSSAYHPASSSTTNSDQDRYIDENSAGLDAELHCSSVVTTVSDAHYSSCSVQPADQSVTVFSLEGMAMNNGQFEQDIQQFSKWAPLALGNEIDDSPSQYTAAYAVENSSSCSGFSESQKERSVRRTKDADGTSRSQGRRACGCPECVKNIGTPRHKVEARVHVCHVENCGKTYGKTSHLRAHLRWHAGDRPFICTWPRCTKRFTRSDELKRHSLTHTRVKNFVCSECGKRFLRKDHLTKHYRTHPSRLADGEPFDPIIVYDKAGEYSWDSNVTAR